MKRILCAPDSFKGTLDAASVAASMQHGLQLAGRSDLEAVCCPLADGGEGTAAVLAGALDAEWVTVHDVPGPSDERIDARYAVDRRNRRAVIDLASASGWHLISDASRSIMERSTAGTGVLIRHAMTQPIDTIILGIGGSATCDGGLGLLQEVGAVFRDATGRVMDRPITPSVFPDVASISPVRPDVAIRVAVDVTNPLLGPNGAAAVYGPQKGASPSEVDELDRALAHVASLSEDDAQQAGCGAAGGTAFGLRAWAGASLEPGIDLVCDVVGFTSLLADAALLITGEGRFDAQSRFGKVVDGVVRRAHDVGVPTALVCGSIADVPLPNGVVDVFDLSAELDEEFAMERTEEAVATATARLVSRILADSA